MVYVYEMPPINLFTGATPLIEFLAAYECDPEALEKLTNLIVEGVYKIAKSEDMRWDGGAGNIHVFSLPYDGEMQLGIVWKQNHGGTTYVVSPEELSYLNRYK